MRFFIVIISWFVLSGCSASWHVERAIKKQPDIIHQIYGDTITEIEVRTRSVYFDYTDTITFEKIDTDLFVINQFDTVTFDSIRYLFKYIYKDSISVILKDSIIYTTIEKVVEVKHKTQLWKLALFIFIALTVVYLIRK